MGTVLDSLLNGTFSNGPMAITDQRLNIKPGSKIGTSDYVLSSAQVDQ